MLKRPSSRRRTNPQEVQLNLVPMLDALVTMIAFLMYTMAFMSLTMIESPLPIVSSSQNQSQLKERPLQLTITFNEKDTLLWSPFDMIPQQSIPNHPDGSIDALKLHEVVIGIKQKFPTETKIIFVPKGNTSYDTIVIASDAVRAFDKTDPVISVPNPTTGVQEQAKQLFGEVVFGNLLGGDE
jgi:biopolymer transport protein ExbD